MQSPNTVEITSVTRGTTRYNDPMWILVSSRGDKIFIFKEQLYSAIWRSSGYFPYLDNLENEDAVLWETYPIVCNIMPRGKYFSIVNVVPKPDEAKPDVGVSPPASIFLVYGEYWRKVLKAFEKPTVIFDTETTGTNPNRDEVVSIAIQDFNDEAQSYYTFIRPNFPQKLLKKDLKGISPFDVHGIHPDKLASYSDFSANYEMIKSWLAGKTWVCWNADFDVTLLDSLCFRNDLPLIPRTAVYCAMKIFSPYAQIWQPSKNDYKWARLEEMAKKLGMPEFEAHDAAEDVQATIDVVKGVQRELMSYSPF